MTPTPEAARWRKSSFSDGQDSCVELACDWRKSSRSGQDSECVELSRIAGAVRDSKNPTGPVLTVELSTLLTAVKSGRLDH